MYNKTRKSIFEKNIVAFTCSNHDLCGTKMKTDASSSFKNLSWCSVIYKLCLWIPKEPV